MAESVCPCDNKIVGFCKVLCSPGSSIAQKCSAMLGLTDFWAGRSDAENEALYSRLCPKVKAILDRFWEINMPVPATNGRWTGNRSDSVFYFDDSFVPKDTRNGMNWKELVAEYKKDFSLRVDGGVRYSKCKIDLKPYAVASVRIRYEDSDLSKLRNRGGSSDTVQEIGAPYFEAALKSEIKRGGYKDIWEFKDGMHNGEFVRNTPLLIHEDYDGQTLMLVPKILHDNWKHYGGIALVSALLDVV